MTEDAVVREDRYHVALFDGSNYAAWAYRVRVLLEEYELWDCVLVDVEEIAECVIAEGDVAATQTEKKTRVELEKKRRRKCKRILIERIHDSQLEYVQDKLSPKDVWNTLRNVFERKSVASRMYLKRQLLSMRFDNGRLVDHLLRFDKIIREYRGTGAEMDEIDVICHLLITLGPAFSAVVTSIETMHEDNLSMEFVKCRLLDEETKQKQIGVELFTPASETAAFSGTRQTKKLRCFLCNKEGHKCVDCPERKMKKQHEEANVAGSTMRDSVCFVGVRGGPEPQETQRHGRWFLDSGASDHLARERELFVELHKLPRPVEVEVAKDGEHVVAKYCGTVKMVSEVNGQFIKCTVKNVLYVPQLRYNLLSVLRIDEAGMRVVFYNGEARIYQGNELVLCGTRCDKLYELDICPIEYDCIGRDSVLWHRRFGHICGKSLTDPDRNDMVSGLRYDETVVCESCAAGKQTHELFIPWDGKHSSRVFEVIDSDVCAGTPEDEVGI